MTNGHPRLVFTAADLPALRAKAETPVGRAILDRLRAVLKGPDAADLDGADVGFHAAGHGLLACLSGDAGHAEAARRLAEMAMADARTHHGERLWRPGYKAIIRTDPAVGVALAYDLCHEAWPAAFRERVAGELATRARELIKGGGQGWNPSPNSNWHANTRSAAGLCAMAVLGDPGARDAPASLRAARDGIEAWLAGQIGDRGWTQESFAYYRYPVAHHVLPFVRAYRQAVAPEAWRGTALDWLALFYVQLLVPGTEAVPIVNGGGGPGGWEWTRWRSGDFAMGLGTVPPARRGALLWLYDRRHGLAGDRTFDILLPHHALFALADVPADPAAAAVDPAEVMDRAWVDAKRGLVLLRNRWSDAGDCVVCLDANVAPRRGTGKPACTGGLAMVGLGAAWAGVDPERKKARAGYSLLLADEADERAGGRLLAVETRPDGGGLVGVDLGAVFGRPAARWLAVDYGGTAGAPLLVAVADRADGAAGATWQWVLGEGVRGRVTNDGFLLSGPGGARLRGLVALPEAAEVTVADGRVRVTGGTTFLVVVVAAEGDPPPMRAARAGQLTRVTCGRQAVTWDGRRLHLAR